MAPPKGAVMRRRLDTSYHRRMMADRMRDPEFRAEYEMARRAIGVADSKVRPSRARRGSASTD